MIPSRFAHRSSEDHSDTSSHLNIFQELKERFNVLEPSPRVVFTFLGAFICIGCLLIFLDFGNVSRRLGYARFSFLGLFAPSAEFGTENVHLGFLDTSSSECDIFDGNWIWDDGYPLYQSKDCPFIDGGFRCLENGRPDSFYTKWRWQPKDCMLPRFDAHVMLQKLRNRRLAFIGDSVGRNQWESLLCMLSAAVPDSSSIYELNGSPITKHKGFLAFVFSDYNCSVEYYRAPFLIYQGRPPSGSPQEVKMSLRLDKLDPSSSKWRDADLLIFNAGHWWNYDKTIRWGCYFQEDEMIKMDMSIETAYRRSIVTLIQWMKTEVNLSRTHVFFRTYSPVHFRGGDWKNGGSCHLETLPELGSRSGSIDNLSKAFFDVLSSESHGMNLNILNVTDMSAQRKDGHASLYYTAPGMGSAPLHRQDCSHWCLPGIPDAWNELLYAIFLKQESLSSQTSKQ